MTVSFNDRKILDRYGSADGIDLPGGRTLWFAPWVGLAACLFPLALAVLSVMAGGVFLLAGAMPFADALMAASVFLLGLGALAGFAGMFLWM